MQQGWQKHKPVETILEPPDQQAQKILPPQQAPDPFSQNRHSWHMPLLVTVPASITTATSTAPVSHPSNDIPPAKRSCGQFGTTENKSSQYNGENLLTQKREGIKRRHKDVYVQGICMGERRCLNAGFRIFGGCTNNTG